MGDVRSANTMARRSQRAIVLIFGFRKGYQRFRAGDRTRTGDVQLGKLAFYQLNYARKAVRQRK